MIGLKYINQTMIKQLIVHLQRGMMMFKLFQLKTRRFFRSFFRGFGFKISIIFLIFSVAVALMVIIPNCFDRAPIYAYFIRELELPITYELSGKVETIDVDGTIIYTEAEIFIGGYSASTDSNGEFDIIFSAPATKEIFIVIRYINLLGEITIKTESLLIEDGTHVIEKEFKYYV